MDLNSTIPLAIATAFLAEVIMFLSSSKRHWPNVVIIAPRVKSVCSFVSLVQTNLGTKSVCNLVTTKRSNCFGYTNLYHSRSHKIEKPEKNGFGPFSYKFFVPIRVGPISISNLTNFIRTDYRVVIVN